MKKKSRRSFFKKAGLSLASVSFSSLLQPVLGSHFGIKNIKKEPEIFFTNGFKIAEVGSKSALLWTRLCAQQSPNPVLHSRKDSVFRHPIDFDEDMPVDQMDGAVLGLEGLARATLINVEKSIKSDWFPALAKNDFTVEIPFDELESETNYQLIWEAKLPHSEKIFESRGSFHTAPEPESWKPIQVVTSTCQYFWSFDNDKRGFDTYDSMSRFNPDFFVHTGDYIYYDKPGPLANTIEKARHKWHAMNSWPSLIDFFKHTPIYMLKDDHDLLTDDAYPSSKAYGELTFEKGIKIWNENAPIRDKPYRTFCWGKDLQIWLVEGREFRSPNNLEDGPNKTIWGSRQKEWFQETVNASNTTFKILFSPTPVVGPDREKKIDNHSNHSFQNEGDWLREYLSAQKNMYVVNGDRHWQYVSVDEKTGLVEFGSGPVSDSHAQGWEQDDLREAHRFLRVKGGFMGITVDRVDGKPIISFTHYDTKGIKVHEERFLGIL